MNATKSKTQLELAKKLRTNQCLISKYHSANRVPYKRLLQIEAATGVPRHQLAPELFEGYQRIAPLPQSQAMGAESQATEELRPC